jgi:hypothetical protein
MESPLTISGNTNCVQSNRHFVKLLGRYMPFWDSALGKRDLQKILTKLQKITENRKIEQFAKFVLWCSLRSHHKTSPTPKMTASYLALPAHHPKQETLN